jgi:hypothetical protein
MLPIIAIDFLHLHLFSVSVADDGRRREIGRSSDANKGLSAYQLAEKCAPIHPCVYPDQNFISAIASPANIV